MAAVLASFTRIQLMVTIAIIKTAMIYMKIA